jgi:hypothetical protein
MINLKISVPVCRINSWDSIETDGRIEIASDTDSLSDSYEALKNQVNELLRELDAENHLLADLKELNSEIACKKNTLSRMDNSLKVATEQYERLATFLKAFGINPNDSYLVVDNDALLKLGSPAPTSTVDYDDEIPM